MADTGQGAEMSETRIFKGARPRELPRPNRTYNQGRVCEQDGCETRLSMYNRSRYCWAHTPLKFPVVRGERRRRRPAA